MTNGEKIALAAMKKEHKSLSRKAELAKNKTQECIDAATTIISIRQKANEILKGDHSHSEKAELITRLAAQEKKAIKAGQQNLVKLMDKELEFEFAANDLAREISRLEFRYQLRSS